MNPLPGLELSLNANIQSAKFDSTVAAGDGAVIGGIEKGNRLPTVQIPIRCYGDLWAARQRQARLVDHRKRAAHRRSLRRAGGSGSRSGLGAECLFLRPITQASGSGINDIGHCSFPPTPRQSVGELELGERPAGVTLRQEPVRLEPKLSIDRERGLRARSATTSASPDHRLTLRHSFASEPEVVMHRPPAAPPPARAPATQTCGDGSVILATDACPAPPPPPPPPLRTPSAGDRLHPDLRKRQAAGPPFPSLSAARSHRSGGVSLAPAILKAAPMGSTSHIAVIGAGVFGAWTAHHLRRAGHRVDADRRIRDRSTAALVGRRIADDARGLWRRRNLHPHGARSLAQWKDLSAIAACRSSSPTACCLLPQGRGLSRPIACRAPQSSACRARR